VCKGLRGFEGPAGSRRGCALLRCEGSTARGLDGSGSKWPFGPLRLDCGAARGAGEAQRARARGAGWAEVTEGRCLRGRNCRVLACVAEGCAVKELLRASRHGAAGESSSGCRLQAAGALSLSPLGWRRCVPVRHQQTDLRSVAVPGGLRARCQIGMVAEWVRARYDSTRGQLRRGRWTVAVGGARSWGRGSGRINGRRRGPDKTKTETQAIRAETQNPEPSSGCVDAEALGACA
jgi:hypothetical protein